MQEGVAQLPAYGADDMTFFQEEEVFPALPAVLPTLIDDEEEDTTDNPATKTDAKPGGKRKLTDEEVAAKKVRYSLCGSMYSVKFPCSSIKQCPTHMIMIILKHSNGTLLKEIGTYLSASSSSSLLIEQMYFLF